MITGRCECRAVTFSIDGPLRDVTNCHCGRCRRFTGHFMAATRAANADLSVQGEVTWYSPEPSVAYGFCRTCGSSLFWKVVGSDRTSICAGTLDGPTGLRTTSAWWTAEHADYHERAAGLIDYEYET